jgi:hypothetical protein
MEQRSLFSRDVYGGYTASDLSRSDDGMESKAAASRIAEKLSSEQAWCVQCVRERPNLTAMELAQIFCPKDPRRIGRRLGECDELGKLRRGQSRSCTITGRLAATWVSCGED